MSSEHLFTLPLDISRNPALSTTTAKRKRLASSPSSPGTTPSYSHALAPGEDPLRPPEIYAPKGFPLKALPSEWASFHASPEVLDQPRSLIPRPDSLKQKHFAVLNTVLHTCLLRHDFPRARRAFAMLLRAEYAGHSLDLRKNGMWGVGAEVLLREDQLDCNVKSSGSRYFSDEGFAKAKAYYERLILQYPPNKFHSGNTSALHFYPAMFSLWIYQVVSRSEIARHPISSASPSPPSTTPSSSDLMKDQRLEEIRRFRTRELSEAREIVARLDSILASPPYDQHARLLLLRGMLAQWSVDLMEEIGGYDVRDVDAERKKAEDAFDDAKGVPGLGGSWFGRLESMDGMGEMDVVDDYEMYNM